MPLSSFSLALAKLIYRLPPPPKERTRELEVLCLGIPRSGTDSLHKALRMLGYSNISHGFIFWGAHADTSELYYRLAKLRLQGRTPTPEVMRTEYFDRVLGEFDGTTDIPACWFGAELLAAYPNAKVILNRRRDVAAWKSSFREAVIPLINSWTYWFGSWFEAELFWTTLMTNETWYQFLDGRDFEQGVEEAYAAHYEKMEAVCRSQGREWLDWSVEEGWEPVCKFLDKPVPDQPFPKGNVAAEFAGRLAESDAGRFWRLKRNFLVFTCVSVAAGAWLGLAVKSGRLGDILGQSHRWLIG